MIVRREALRGALLNLIAMLDHDILIDETMADAASRVARDFAEDGQPGIAAYLYAIARQHRVRALHVGGQQAALRSEYGGLL